MTCLLSCLYTTLWAMATGTARCTTALRHPEAHRKVKATLCGHAHRYAYEMWDGVHLINLPAVGYNFNDDQPVGWVDAKLSAVGGSFTLHAIGGNLQKDGKTVEVAWRS
jgi:3',5'-cyclic-AMP phosphodiesterase